MKTAIEFKRGRVSGLVPLFAAAVLTACGGGGSDSTEPTPAATPAPVPAAVAPAITTDVSALAVGVGADASFTVTATGTNPTYQWQSSVDGVAWVDIAGATTDTLLLKAVAFTDGGKRVRVVVSNSAGSVTSNPGLLTVNPGDGAPTVATQPLAVSLVAPAVATFTVTATGTPAPTYQWQRSNDAGVTFANVGTGASYSTAATAVTDSGALFRVVVSNAAGATTSDAVALSVAASTIAPVIAAQPQAVNVTAPSSATFGVTASGAPTPTFQWQISRDAGASFANIAGATAPSYTTPATVVADNGARYRVVATNAAGAVTSSAVTLGVAAVVGASPLAGRAWMAGQQLETDDNTLEGAFSDIDDAGRLMVVFQKYNGTRNVLYATLGTPGATGTAPVFSAPVVIDTLAGAPLTAPPYSPYAAPTFGMASAPNGNAVAAWISKAPCTAATYSISGTCNYLYTARYLAGSGTWEAPVLVGDTPSAVSTLRINSAGDIALRFSGWQRKGTNSYTSGPSIAWKAAASSAFRQRVFTDVALGDLDFAMDAAGNMLLAGEATQNATTDLVAYRGTLASGFGAQETLDTRGSAARFNKLAVGLNGQLLVVWNQSNGVSTTLFAATSATAAGAFTVTDLGFNRDANGLRVVATDAGDAIVYDLGAASVLRWSANVWSARQSLPTGALGFITSDYNFARNGNFMSIDDSGRWTTYDATRNATIAAASQTSPGSGYVLGLVINNAGFGEPHLSISGIGAVTLFNQYDVLPTPVKPAGDGRKVTNLWATYLK